MLAIWCLPTLLWLLSRRGSPAAFRMCGLVAAGWWWIGWGVVVGLVSYMLGHIALLGVPAIAAAGGLMSVAAAAAGEEVFFRGFLQGWLSRRRGEVFGLWAQAVLFLLPHLLLMLVDARLWVLLPVQFLAGLALGVLRRGSGSVWPGVVGHVLTNVMSALLLG